MLDGILQRTYNRTEPRGGGREPGRSANPGEKTRNLNPNGERRALRMLGLLLLLTSVGAAVEPSLTPLVFETDSYRYVISPDGTSLEFVDKATGRNYCDVEKRLPFATWIDDAAHPATGVRRDGDLMAVQFGDANREARFRVTAHRRRLEFELTSLGGSLENLRELHFASIPLTLSGGLDEPFAVSPLALKRLCAITVFVLQI